MVIIKTLALLSLLSSSVLGTAQNVKRGTVGPGSDIPMLDEYEYVVVGSGPGGSPLASRLALAGHSVLLIEAGEDFTGNPVYDIPVMHIFASEYKDMRWSFFVNHYDDFEKQRRDPKMTYRLPDGSHYIGLDPPPGAEPLGILYPRAAALGGCSAHNALITIYPNDQDWTEIQMMTGDDTWEQSRMREYYKKAERCEYLPNDPTSHGYNGWLSTATTPLYLVAEDVKVLSLVVAAASAIGKTILSGLVSTVTGLANVLVNDINSATTGAGSRLHQLYQVPLAMHSGKFNRGGPAEFVHSTVSQARLDVALNTFVTDITWDLSGGVPKATGVNFIHGTGVYGLDERDRSAHTPGSVRATREVIISGGTFNSPQLLKVSGVGPRAELESLGINVVVDLPGVGTNMQDRYEIGVAGQTDTDFFLLQGCTFLQTPGDDPCYDKWTNDLLTGPYSTNGIAIGILQQSSVAADERPDIFMSGFPGLFKGYFEGYAELAVKERNWWTWLVLKAHSRNNAGTVTLRSASPFDMPNITFNSFGVGGAEDLAAVREGIAFGRRAFSAQLPLDGSFPEHWPGPEVTSDADLDEFITNEAWGHHACCTNAIGPDGDPWAVLDSRFRVRGTRNLRVVDASVFPKIPGYYLALPTYIISEKAADDILADAVLADAK